MSIYMCIYIYQIISLELYKLRRLKDIFIYSIILRQLNNVYN